MDLLLKMRHCVDQLPDALGEQLRRRVRGFTRHLPELVARRNCHMGCVAHKR